MMVLIFNFAVVDWDPGLSFGGSKPYLEDLGPVYMEKFLKASSPLDYLVMLLLMAL